MLGYLEYKPGFTSRDVQGVKNFRKSILKLYVDNGTNNGTDFSFVACRCSIGIITTGLDALESGDDLSGLLDLSRSSRGS
jgi:hypothetical protein